MKSQVRDHILKTASQLFYKKGYNLTGINEIIKESGIAKATLYNNFKSKEDLLVAYLIEQDTQLLQSLAAYCDNKPRGNKRLFAVLHFLKDFFHQQEFNGCWCIRSIAEVPLENKRVRAIIKRNKQSFRDFLTALVNENRPSLNSTHRKQLADRIYILYEGAITESHIHQDSWPIKSAIRLLKDILAEE